MTFAPLIPFDAETVGPLCSAVLVDVIALELAFRLAEGEGDEDASYESLSCQAHTHPVAESVALLQSALPSWKHDSSRWTGYRRSVMMMKWLVHRKADLKSD